MHESPKQIGLAILNYESSIGPPMPNTEDPIITCYVLLPYLVQQAVYDR